MSTSQHDPLGATDSEASPAAPNAAPTLFGFDPDDWFSGANMGWTAEVCFVAEPSTAQRGEIEAQLDALCVGSPVERDSKPSYWSGPWMLFLFGEGRANGDDTDDGLSAADRERDVFASLSRVLKRLHATSPIRQAFHLTARENGGDVDAVPLNGPPHEGHSYPDEVFGRCRDSALPAYTLGEDHTLLRRAARERVAAESQARNQAATDAAPVETHADSIAVQRSVVLAAPFAPGMPLDARAPFRDRDAAAGGQDLKIVSHSNWRGDVVTVLRGAHPEPDRIGWVDGDRFTLVDMPVPFEGHALSPDGTTLLIANYEDERLVVHRVTRDSHERILGLDAAAVVGWKRPVKRVAFTADGGYVLQLSGYLLAFASLELADTPTSTLKRDSYGFEAALDGRVFLLEGEKRNTTWVVGCSRGLLSLLKVISVKLERDRVRSANGRLAFVPTGDAYEVTGVAAAVGWTASDTPTLRPRTPSADPFVAYPADPSPATQPEPQVVDAKAILTVVLPDGRSLFFYRERTKSEYGVFSLGFSAVATGKLCRLKQVTVPGDLWGPVFSVRPDGMSVVLRTGDLCEEVSTVDGSVRALGTLARNSRFAALNDAVLMNYGGLKRLATENGAFVAKEEHASTRQMDGDVNVALGGAIVFWTERTGGSGTPTTQVWVNQSGALRRVGDVPIGVLRCWTVGTSVFVKTWHGPDAYELPNLHTLLANNT